MAIPYTNPYAPGPEQPSKINPSCFGRIDYAADSVSTLRARISNLVDRLVGPELTECAASNQPPQIGPSGILPQAEKQAGAICRYVDEINAELDRLEKALP